MECKFSDDLNCDVKEGLAFLVCIPKMILNKLYPNYSLIWGCARWHFNISGTLKALLCETGKVSQWVGLVMNDQMEM